MVGSGARKARAISSVVRPPISRSVSATRASVDSTGWHAVNIRRSRSSPMSSSSASSMCSSADSCSLSRSRPISACLRSVSLCRRSRSIARRLAVVISHAPGFSGIPDTGHCSSAATSASCASSSASATSRTIRARPAISFACSIRQTASMARWVSAAGVSVAIAATDTRSSKRRHARVVVRGLQRCCGYRLASF